MNRNYTGIIIIAVIVVAGGWYLLRGTPASAPEVSEEATSPVTVESTATTTEMTVAYTNQGFSPANLTVPAGTTVNFVTQGDDRMWVASDIHPSHENYDGTTKNEHCAADYSGPVPFDQCSAGSSYSFTFTKAGTWNYHNHANAAHTGTIIVTAPTPTEATN